MTIKCLILIFNLFVSAAFPYSMECEAASLFDIAQLGYLPQQKRSEDIFIKRNLQSVTDLEVALCSKVFSTEDFHGLLDFSSICRHNSKFEALGEKVLSYICHYQGELDEELTTAKSFAYLGVSKIYGRCGMTQDSLTIAQEALKHFYSSPLAIYVAFHPLTPLAKKSELCQEVLDKEESTHSYMCEKARQGKQQAEHRLRSSLCLKYGMRAFENRKFDRALELFTELLKLEPENPSAHYYWGQAFLKSSSCSAMGECKNLFL